MNEQMKPCPFCGKADQLELDTLGDPDDWYIECDRCRLGTHAVFQGSERTLALWNRRPIEDALREALTDVIEIAEHCAPRPAHPGPCGPEALCDGACVDASNCSETIRKARAVLEGSK